MPCDITREKRGAERHSTETSGIGSLLDEKQSKGECEFAFFFSSRLENLVTIHKNGTKPLTAENIPSERISRFQRDH